MENVGNLPIVRGRSPVVDKIDEPKASVKVFQETVLWQPYQAGGRRGAHPAPESVKKTCRRAVHSTSDDVPQK